MFVHTRSWSTEKPPVGSQINWGHPLSQRLVGCWLINEGGGRNLNELVNQNNGVSSGVWGNSIKGKVISFTGTQVANCSHRGIPVNMLNQTWWCWIYPTTIDTTVRRVMVIDNTDSANYYTRLGVTSANVAGAFEFHKSKSTGGISTRMTSTENAVAVNIWQQVVVTWNGVNASGMELYVNRKKVSGATTDSTMWDDSSGNFRIGNRQDGGAPFLGKIALVLLWNRILTRTELFSLYEAPYQFIQPMKRTTYFFPTQEEPPVTAGGIMTPRSSYWGDL